jgi:Chloramphenicol phosphotransferase-like protein
VPLLYAAFYDSVATHSRLGLNIAVDVGHYDAAILADVARRLDGLPVLFVGVFRPIEVIMERRRASGAGLYAVSAKGEAIPAPVLRWRGRSTAAGPTTSSSTRRGSARSSAHGDRAAAEKRHPGERVSELEERRQLIVAPAPGPRTENPTD